MLEYEDFGRTFPQALLCLDICFIQHTLHFLALELNRGWHDMMMLRAWQMLLVVIWLMLLLLPACQSFSLKTRSNHNNDGRSRHIQENERPNRKMSKKNNGESDNYATKSTPEKPKRKMKRRPKHNPRSAQHGSLDDDDQYDCAHDVKRATATVTSSIKSLFTRIESYCSNQEDLELVQKSINFTLQVRDSISESNNKIDNQHTTKNNEINIMQAIGTARVIAEMKLDVSSIIAGVLYSCFWSIGERNDDESQTDVNLFHRIRDEFGPSIEKLVTGVYKIDQAIDSGSGMTDDDFDDIQKKTEKYRKMIVAMAGDDIRILLIKLADQTHVVRTLLRQQQVEEQSHSNRKLQQHAKSIGRDTITLFAPLAHRLGLYTLKTELEELSFRLWKPDEFRQLQLMVSARKEQRQRYTNEVIRILEDRLNQEGIAVVGRDKNVDYGDKDLPTSSSSSSLATVTGRAKSFYSIHQKIKSQKKRFDDIQDLIAFRILVKDISQCYEALGVVTSKFEPEPGRFKDYIAKPKPNGYQSIHSTVIGPEEKRIEVQIRTYDMHEAAENGVAAHFLYKDGAGGTGSGKKKSENDDEAKHYSMLRQLVEWIQTTDGPDKEDAEASAKQRPATIEGNGDSGGGTLSDGVFVFSPQGQLFEITNGSSVLDFAYRIHSDLGNKCVGAKVDGKMVPLKYQLRNGETIEIIRSSTQTPRQEWLKFVQTSKAQSRIKSWLYKDERARQQQDIDTVSHGRQLLEKAITKHITSQQQKRRVQHHGVDAFKVYKEKLNDILSKFKFNDEREFLICLSLGQISIVSVIHEIFSTPGRRQITIPSSSSISLLEDAFGNEVVLKSMEESETIRRPAKSDDGIVVGGKRNILVTFCRSCKPLFGEMIKGVVTQGRGVKVHRTDCKYLLESDEERCVNAAWDEAAKSTPRGATEVEVIFDYEPGILAGMTKTILSCKVNIGSVKIKRISDGRGLARFDLMLSTIDELNQITSQLLQEKGILFIKRR